MLIVNDQTHIKIEVRNSKFIAFLVPIDSQEDARLKVEDLRRQYPDATHVVHAFQLGKTGDIFGMTDDGEPHGTAGRPVFEVLKGSGITNVILLVVRYFGGTKLGTGGLVKAYTRSAQEVIAAASTEELVAKTDFHVRLPYHLFDQAKLLLLQNSALIVSEKFTTDVELAGSIPLEKIEIVRSGLHDLSRGSLEFETEKEPKG